MRRALILSILALSALFAQSPFLQKPYLQLGNAPKLSDPATLALLWHTPDRDGDWIVEYQPEGGEWHKEQGIVVRRIDVRGLTPHRVYQAVLADLRPGAEFVYRVTLGGKPVFQSQGRARRAAGDRHSFAVYGDMSQDSSGQKALAWQIYKAKPDYLLSTGDIVYSRGLASEYYRKYFPIYNCDSPAPDSCAPILRSTLTFAVPGNHDAGSRVDLGALPDALAYFYYWNQPLNGPLVDPHSSSVTQVRGTPQQVREFNRSAPNFPRMAMFSFDYGDAHWTMLDSNSYVDWTDPKLRDWVRNDIRSGKSAAWRFVVMHHPAFQSSHKHSGDQWMRLMADIFEQEGVDVVFSGHVHNYQRTRPLRFKVKPELADERPMRKDRIDGEIAIDKQFDGKQRTKANGIIWIVTGAGGASLYDAGQESNPESWQDYTVKFVSTVHSFTLVDISPESLNFRQISRDGKELDRFTLTH